MNYRVRDDGVLYTLSHGVQALVNGTPDRLKVEMWKADALLPADKGDIATDRFRKRLLMRARETFGEVPNLERDLGLMAREVDGHLREASRETRLPMVNAPQADRMMAFVMEESQGLFVDQHGLPNVLLNGEPVPLAGRRCHRPFRKIFFEREQTSCGSGALATAADTLAARAESSGEVRELHTRAAFHEGALFYELRPGRVVRIDSRGWSLAPDPPVLFRRYVNLKPLPDPEPGGSLDALDQWVNLKEERDRRLFKAYVATVAMPHIGRPIFNASGAMGSGKTTASRVIKRLWDPTAPETVRYDSRDFLQKASHAHILMLDNLNTLPEPAADILCRLVTGEADAKRRLYSDDDDVIVELRKAVLLNGINVPTDRGDVLDRSLVVELERIPDTARKSEKEVWDGFEREHPRLLGAAFETIANAMRLKPSMELSRRPRLADWGEYAAAVYQAFGWEEDGHEGGDLFLKDWKDVVFAQNRAALDGSPAAQAIIAFMEDKSEHSSPSSQLHEELAEVASRLRINKDPSWPRSARWLWRRILEVLPLLETVGIKAYRRETSSNSIIELRKVPG